MNFWLWLDKETFVTYGTVFVLLLLLLVPLLLFYLNVRKGFAKKPITDNQERYAKVTKVVDGDTIEVEVDLGFGFLVRRRVRFLGVNTPEVRGEEHEAGIVAKAAVEAMLASHARIRLHCPGFAEDRYGRILAWVWVSEDVCLNHWLVEQGLGWPTDEDGTLTTPRDLGLLFGIPKKA